MTSGGDEAARIRRWAWGDPAGRVAEAIRRVDGLAEHAGGQELREIQDSATMLSRLAGTLDTGPVIGTDTLLGQLANDTITSQLIDLAHEPGWMHERRGPDGKWISGGGAAKSVARSAKGDARLRRIQAAQARHRTMQESSGNKAADVVKAVGGTPSSSPHSMQEADAMFERTGQLIQTPREKALHAQIMNRAQAVAASAVTEVKKQEDTHAARKAKLKIATEAGLAITGGALTYLAVKSGAPEIFPIIGSVGPFLIQTIIEFFKKL